jgi:hypothetical protein
MVKVALFSALLFLAACQTTGGSFCSIAKPVRPAKETVDKLSDAEVSAILAHNKKGERLCKWKA